MARDTFHQEVRQALEKDGWEITNDPYKLKTLGINYEIDLGAEKLLSAQKAHQKIAIEIKTFSAMSFAHEFHRVLGQYLNYTAFLDLQEPDRLLYLAITKSVYRTYFTSPAIQYIVDRFNIRIIVFNPKTQVIEQWLEK
jgi:XisH protein